MLDLDVNKLKIRKVDYDKILEYDEIVDVTTSDKFNTENLLVVPTDIGLSLGMKVRFKNKQGKVCQDVRYVLDLDGTPTVFIGDDNSYQENFTEGECFVPVERQVCDSKETNWFHHKVEAFPVFTRQIDSVRVPVAENSIFEFSSENYDSEYFANGKTMNYLSPKGLSVLMKYLESNPIEVVSRVCDGISNDILTPENIIPLNLEHLDNNHAIEIEKAEQE